MTYAEAVRRVQNLEPFSEGELAEVRAMPGVTVEVGSRVRRGTILAKIEARHISLLDGSAKYPRTPNGS